MSVPGGLTGAKPANEDVQKLLDQAKEDIKSHSGGKDVSNLKAVSYKTQIVAGVNYVIKAHDGNGHIHVKIHKALPHEGEKLTVLGVQHGKSHDDEIEFF